MGRQRREAERALDNARHGLARRTEAVAAAARAAIDALVDELHRLRDDGIRIVQGQH